MWLLLVLGLLLAGGQQPDGVQVELFDTDKERVVRQFANTAPFQQEAKEILDSVSGRVMELNPPLDKALIVKIPLSPVQKLQVPKARLDASIYQMFVVMPKHGQRRPYLILHTEKEETLVVEFARDVEKLRHLIEW